MSNHDDMNTPVTRGELREELDQRFEKFEQKLEQKLDQKLDQRFEAFERKLDQKFATKSDLELWAGALLARVSAEISAQVSAQVSVQMSAQTRALSAEFARHTQTILDHVASMIAVVDDKYRDLPGRVTQLETEVASRRPRRR